MKDIETLQGIEAKVKHQRNCALLIKTTLEELVNSIEATEKDIKALKAIVGMNDTIDL